jgi:hypothetical protein
MPDEYEDEKWVPDEALASLAMETDVNPEETHEARAKRLLVENVDVAATSLIWIAKNDPNSRMRADASKYIMERVLGRAGDAPATGTLDDLFSALDRMNENAAAMAQSTPHSAPPGTTPNSLLDDDTDEG